MALGRCVDQTSAHVSWIANIEAIGHSFPRQAVQMVWDFVESVPIGDQSANFMAALGWIAKVIEQTALSNLRVGQTSQADACDLPLPQACSDVYFTDPPYYDAVPYSDLADFFLLWLNQVNHPKITNVARIRDASGLSPKTQESVWNQAHLANGKPKDRKFFEDSVNNAFFEGRRSLKEDGMVCCLCA
jgi:adenine-specific DNA methylase